MTRIIYAHLGCPYCESLLEELEERAARDPDASKVQMGFDDHWARYENNNNKE